MQRLCDTPAIDYSKLGSMVRRARTRGQRIDGVSKSSVTRMEAGDCGKFMSRSVFYRLCRFLRVPPEAFSIANAGKIVHYADASTTEKIQAALWADESLTEKIQAALWADESLTEQARDALLDLMETAVANLEEK